MPGANFLKAATTARDLNVGLAMPHRTAPASRRPPHGHRSERREGTRGHWKLFWDLVFGALRLIGRHAHGFYTTVGLFLLAGVLVAIAGVMLFAKLAGSVRVTPAATELASLALLAFSMTVEASCSIVPRSHSRAMVREVSMEAMMDMVKLDVAKAIGPSAMRTAFPRSFVMRKALPSSAFAAGAIAWGRVTEHFGVFPALVTAACWLLASSLVGVRFRPISHLEKLDLTPSGHAPHVDAHALLHEQTQRTVALLSRQRPGLRAEVVRASGQTAVDPGRAPDGQATFKILTIAPYERRDGRVEAHPESLGGRSSGRVSSDHATSSRCARGTSPTPDSV